MRRVVAFDPATGSLAYVDYDESTDTFRYVQEIEAEPLLDYNRQLYNEAPDHWGDGAVAARMPLELYFDLKRQGIMDDERALKRWLNDLDNQKFRTRRGTV